MYCFIMSNRNYQEKFRARTAINKSQRTMSQADSFVRYTLGSNQTSLSGRREIRLCPAPHSKRTPRHRTRDVRTHTDGFLKGQRDGRATMSARIAQRGIARSLSAFRACH